MIVNMINIWFIVKLLFLFAIAVYIIFSTVVVRQVHLMTNTVKVGFEFPLRLISWLHLFVAIGVFLIALFTL